MLLWQCSGLHSHSCSWGAIIDIFTDVKMSIMLCGGRRSENKKFLQKLLFRKFECLYCPNENSESLPLKRMS